MKSTRRAKERQHRRLFAAGIGTSAALHAAVLGFSTFSVPASTAGVAERNADRSPAPADEAPAMEVVTLAKAPATPAQSPSASVAPSAAAPSPAAGAASPAAAAPRTAAEATPSAALMLAAFEARARPAMKPNFAALQGVSPRGLSALPATAGPGDDLAGHDHGHDEDDGNSWWRRLGISVGSGGGHCKPRPGGTIVSEPREPVTSR